jgi:hypothetical protein
MPTDALIGDIPVKITVPQSHIRAFLRTVYRKHLAMYQPWEITEVSSSAVQICVPIMSQEETVGALKIMGSAATRNQFSPLPYNSQTTSLIKSEFEILQHEELLVQTV